MKKILVVLLLIACCLSCSGCMLMAARVLGGSDDSVPKEVICEYVTTHIDKFDSFRYLTYQSAADEEAKTAYIKEILGEDTIVKKVSRFKPGILEFYCGGTGNVTASTYCGFYYSETDAPCAFEFQNEAKFMQPSEDVYEWESEDGEKAFYTERILPKWFYYHQKWL